MSLAVEVGGGARSTEARLLEVLEELAHEAREDPTLLARPVRVVVPSRSLRLHLAERATARLGALAGLQLQTLHGLAVEVLDRRGGAPEGGDLWIEILARRLAAQEEPLREAFGAFQDGYRSVVATVRDLFDAGFEPDHLEPALERLDGLRLAAPQRVRAAALLRTAAKLARALEERGLGGRASLLSGAREALREVPSESLPTRFLLIHGFADATGRAAELLEALAQSFPARAFFDHPPDPVAEAEGEGEGAGVRFTERLLARLRGHVADVERRPSPGSVAPATVERFRAPGAEAEVRAVAQRLRAALDAGAQPERLALVARDLGPYLAPIRVQFARLGIPASGLRARAPLDGTGRRLEALAVLFDEMAECPADRWLDAVRRLAVATEEPGEGEAGRTERAPSAALRLGLRVLGAGRVEEAAEADLDARLEDDRLRLPSRTGIFVGGEGAERTTRVGQARARGAELRAARAAAASLVKRFARWPGKASLARHLQELERLRRRELGWRSSDREEERLRPALERMDGGACEEELTREEFCLLARRALSAAAAGALGGIGGGVQVLDVMEARARTFDALFVLGLNRDVFPKVVREDALLSDDLRRALADLLPDIPIKARGRDEERYLFAQLVSSAERVTLSWQLADDDGRPKVPSPLVERLLGEASEEDEPTVEPLFTQRGEGAASSGPRTAHESAVLAGLQDGRQGFAGRLERAFVEAGTTRDPAAVAAARARVLESYERGPFEPERLAPWLGFLGFQGESSVRPDPRAEAQFVTRFEALARCPWQAVLTKLLRLEDELDPQGELPGVDPRLLGVVVHGVLQRLVEERTGEGGSLEEVLARAPEPWTWPEPEAFERILREVVAAEIAAQRPPTPGFVELVAECARPYLERARTIWAEELRHAADLGVLGAEVQGRAQVATAFGELPLLFRADRVEGRAGRVTLTDFKTGKPVPSSKLRSTGIPQGTNLQPMAYALGAAGRADAVRARYLFLSEGAGDDWESALGEEWESHLPYFERALETMLGAWLAGTFFPRLRQVEKESEPAACRTCDVAEACLRGDSGAKRALVGWLEREDEDPAGTGLRALFALAGAKAERKR